MDAQMRTINAKCRSFDRIIGRQAAWHWFFRLEIHFKFNIIFNRVNRQILDEETRINMCKHSNKAL